MSDYSYFKKAYKLIAIDLPKPKVLSADPKVKQKVSFTGNQDCAGSATEFFYIRKNKRNYFRFLHKTAKVITKLFWHNKKFILDFGLM